ncbi:MAG: Transcription elongation factor GreA [Microgenomates group bacterium GW2011_GWF2_45_18]|nr:MAG: Transcription elongation factor GreA [Microgenomates group bacterium GW2011_GWF1_44_10]KKU01538.1 MAG: Transcription elongation factor GreA [Microgenomates group bacterium GW2011_GWF2_45_18]OGJ40794.1 MAG: transcription elongation factor GreA [Candidatus Pacebacteria bacterium RIFOXYB1_FULL_44_10]HAU99446.1 transcription elongation factor GreA [Candidatus Paceibacterota bacterium]HAX01548.1 transcription elongation factor GreA [Candidatus Paceibacterota bacterium]
MDTQSIQLTHDGYEEILAELKQLKEEKLPKAIERVATARSFGDLSENAEYHSAREDLAFIEGKVQELEVIAQHAQVVKKTSKTGKKTVSIGTKVTVKVKNSTHVYHIVGEWEANPIEKKISHESPLGKALLGKEKGDKVEIEAPAGTMKYTIVTVE